MASTLPVFDPEFYASNKVAQNGFVDRALAFLSATALPRSTSLLDIGAGDGSHTFKLAESHPNLRRVVGLDAMPEMVTFAQRYQHPSLTFVHGLAEDLDRLEHPACSGTFDLIVSFNVFHWVKDHPRALRAIYNKLSPNGTVFLLMHGEGSIAEFLAGLETTIAQPRWASYFVGFESPFRMFTRERYQQMVRDAGFTTAEVAYWDVMVRHPEGIKGISTRFAAGYTSWILRVPEQLRPEFIQHVATEVVRLTGVDQDGCAPSLSRLLIVHAAKTVRPPALL
eukprot:TRINITY_DN6023_c0_g1_i1.p1 TRINITY_DN6023_c0_g1~~TRINITY_DN6023_c0_g1_i1.p1  ORF type:complete len:281 (-),score=41.48 TRINITY_DN6023_c0_g1_i1:65-907(-)